MISTFDVINIINTHIKIKPLDFGFAGEIYSKTCSWSEPQFDVINKYIYTYQNTCVNRKAIYYSNSFSDALTIIKQSHNDYCFIQQSQLDLISKRYVLFSIIEYVMHSISKLLNICFEDRDFRDKFYIELKKQLEKYTDVIIKLLFLENLSNIQEPQKNLYDDINKFFSCKNTPLLREHVEYDHKLLLVYTYILYFDIIDEGKLLLCPLLGAVQIPPFIKSIEKYFSKNFCINREIDYDYIKYSTYDITDFIPIDEQLTELINMHNKYSDVILLDESLGTGTTLLVIKKSLDNYFNDIKIGAVEFRWDKKITWNNDREWFDIEHIDYITPISYRHYLLLENRIACFKINVANHLPYIPFMIYEDNNFARYMSKQKITDEKKRNMDTFFHKSTLIKDTFYKH